MRRKSDKTKQRVFWGLLIANILICLHTSYSLYKFNVMIDNIEESRTHARYERN